jgi:hypothetical protein
MRAESTDRAATPEPRPKCVRAEVVSEAAAGCLNRGTVRFVVDLPGEYRLPAQTCQLLAQAVRLAFEQRDRRDAVA